MAVDMLPFDREPLLCSIQINLLSTFRWEFTFASCVVCFAKQEEVKRRSVRYTHAAICRVQKIAAVYNVSVWLLLIRACARSRSRSISWQSDSQLADAGRLADLGLGTAEHGARRRWHDDGCHCLRDCGERAGDRHRNTDRWAASASLYYL